MKYSIEEEPVVHYNLRGEDGKLVSPGRISSRKHAENEAARLEREDLVKAVAARGRVENRDWSDCKHPRTVDLTPYYTDGASDDKGCLNCGKRWTLYYDE